MQQFISKVANLMLNVSIVLLVAALVPSLGLISLVVFTWTGILDTGDVARTISSWKYFDQAFIVWFATLLTFPIVALVGAKLQDLALKMYWNKLETHSDN